MNKRGLRCDTPPNVNPLVLITNCTALLSSFCMKKCLKNVFLFIHLVSDMDNKVSVAFCNRYIIVNLAST